MKRPEEPEPAAPEEAGREGVKDSSGVALSLSRPGTPAIRAGALFRSSDYVLLHHHKDDAFWTVVGGRVEFGEFSMNAVVREVKEELGVDCQPVRLVWLVENMFCYAGREHHGIEFYYQCESPGLDPAVTRDPVPAEGDLIVHWFHRSELADLVLYPEFLKTRLAQPWPEGIEHICCAEVPH